MSILRVIFEKPLDAYFNELGDKIMPIPAKETLDKMSSAEILQLDLPETGQFNVRVFDFIDGYGGYCVDFDSDKNYEEGYEFHIGSPITEDLKEGIAKRCQLAMQELNITDNAVASMIVSATY